MLSRGLYIAVGACGPSTLVLKLETLQEVTGSRNSQLAGFKGRQQLLWLP